METFATDVSIGLAERINASSIATTAVDTVINALRSNMNPIRCAFLWCLCFRYMLREIS